MTEAEEPRPIEDLTFREVDDSLRSYERGVALLAALQTRLSEAQQKVDVLMGELAPGPDDEKRDTSLS